ncbi:hypothetical protein Tco_0969890 [Tanacetum coccineum]
MLKKNLGKNMYKNKKKSNNNDEGCVLEMGELKDDLTLIKPKLQMFDKVVVVLVILVAFVVASRILSLLPLCLGMTKFLLVLGIGSLGIGSLTSTTWLSTAILSLAAVCEL